VLGRRCSDFGITLDEVHDLVGRRQAAHEQCPGVTRQAVQRSASFGGPSQGDDIAAAHDRLPQGVAHRQKLEDRDSPPEPRSTAARTATAAYEHRAILRAQGERVHQAIGEHGRVFERLRAT
jgi:hypothetical protein